MFSWRVCVWGGDFMSLDKRCRCLCIVRVLSSLKRRHNSSTTERRWQSLVCSSDVLVTVCVFYIYRRCAFAHFRSLPLPRLFFHLRPKDLCSRCYVDTITHRMISLFKAFCGSASPDQSSISSFDSYLSPIQYPPHAYSLFSSPLRCWRRRCVVGDVLWCRYVKPNSVQFRSTQFRSMSVFVCVCVWKFMI